MRKSKEKEIFFFSFNEKNIEIIPFSSTKQKLCCKENKESLVEECEDMK